jgi:hypothetical protein
MTKWGRTKYPYRAYRGITVVFIEVKLELGKDMELLSFTARVTTECDGIIQRTSNSDHD